MTATTTRDRARVAENSQTVEAAASGRATSGAAVRPRPEGAGGAGFRIRWGRALVALVGLLALLTVAVTAPMAALTPLLAAVPLTAGAVLLLSLATLRGMAVARRRRRRRERLETAMREAMNPAVPAEQQRRPAVPSTAGAPRQVTQEHAAQEQRDRAEHQTAQQRPGQQRGHADLAAQGQKLDQKLDEDGLPQDIAATFGEVPQGEQTARTEEPRAAATESWQPREVPKPQYLEAEKAERAQPEPLVPEEPKPSSEVKIREDLPKSGSPAAAPAAEDRPAGVQESLDLDAVLKRRRA